MSTLFSLQFHYSLCSENTLAVIFTTVHFKNKNDTFGVHIIHQNDPLLQTNAKLTFQDPYHEHHQHKCPKHLQSPHLDPHGLHQTSHVKLSRHLLNKKWTFLCKNKFLFYGIFLESVLFLSYSLIKQCPSIEYLNFTSPGKPKCF